MLYRVFMLGFCFVLIGCRHAQDVAWLDKVKQAQSEAIEKDPLLLLNEVWVGTMSRSLEAEVQVETSLYFVNEATSESYRTAFDKGSFPHSLRQGSLSPLNNPQLHRQINNLTIDPQKAFELAHQEMQPFRAMHGDEWVQSMRLNGLDWLLISPEHPLVWQVIYGSLKTEATFDVLIDAQSGEVLSVEQRADNEE